MCSLYGIDLSSLLTKSIVLDEQSTRAIERHPTGDPSGFLPKTYAHEYANTSPFWMLQRARGQLSRNAPNSQWPGIARYQLIICQTMSFSDLHLETANSSMWKNMVYPDALCPPYPSTKWMRIPKLVACYPRTIIYRFTQRAL